MMFYHAIFIRVRKTFPPSLQALYKHHFQMPISGIVLASLSTCLQYTEYPHPLSEFVAYGRCGRSLFGLHVLTLSRFST